MNSFFFASLDLAVVFKLTSNVTLPATVNVYNSFLVCMCLPFTPGVECTPVVLGLLLSLFPRRYVVTRCTEVYVSPGSKTNLIKIVCDFCQ